MKIPENTQMDADYWRDIERASRLTPQERVREGCGLCDRSFRIMLDGIRHQFPEFSDLQAIDKLNERLTIIREMESSVWTLPTQPSS